MLRYTLRTTMFVLCLNAYAHGQTSANPKDDYHLIRGVSCEVKAQAFTQDAYGNIRASGVKLICDGQSISLVDGVITNAAFQQRAGGEGLLETTDYGTFKVKMLFTLAVYVTDDQNTKLKNFLAEKEDLPSAASHGNMARVKVLLAAQANVNSRNSEGNTALILAAMARDVAIIQVLLASGADVNAKGSGGVTPLLGALEGRTSEQKDLEVVRTLVAAKANVNAGYNDGTTALMAAANHGDLEMVRALLSAGAQVDAKNQRGETALTIASKSGYGEIVKLLDTASASRK